MAPCQKLDRHNLDIQNVDKNSQNFDSYKIININSYDM